MSKAYDRVEWDFVEVLLKKFEFLKRFIHLIMGCIFTVKYSILLNASPLTPIASTRGLRQGDPVSPFLFVLCDEMFSFLLQKAKEKLSCKVLKSINMPQLFLIYFLQMTIFYLAW